MGEPEFVSAAARCGRGNAGSELVPKYVWLILVAIMLAATIGAFLLHSSREDDSSERFNSALSSLQRLEREVRVRAATGGAVLNRRGWPSTIDPAWFGDEPPLNPLVVHGRPWIEIAAPHEVDLFDPAIRQSVSREVAAFWYNPASGIVRARVGVEATDEQALEIYNRLNGRDVTTLFAGGEEGAAMSSPLVPPPARSKGVQTNAAEGE